MTTKYEALARASYERAYPQGDWSTVSKPWRQYWYTIVDAMLEELLKPTMPIIIGLTKGLDTNFDNPTGEDIITQNPEAGWRGGVQAILDER